MMVESRGEVMIDSNTDRRGGQTNAVKGKRTKRQRVVSPLPLTMAFASSSSEGLEGTVSRAGRLVAFDNISSSSSGPMRDSSIGQIEGLGIDEEEDVANCLMILARGKWVTPTPSPAVCGRPDKDSTFGNDGGNRPGGGLDSYQCKTCSRSFPSFQALGGHRTSHKRHKIIMNVLGDETKVSDGTTCPSIVHDRHHANDQSSSTALSLQIQASRPKVAYPAAHTVGNPKVHECSICEAEFTSGQALGGHMRRHRTVSTAPPITTIDVGLSKSSSNNISFQAQDLQSYKKKSRSNLHLDLNLPAPPEENRGSSSKHSSSRLHMTTHKDQILVFSASPLVDCYY